MRYPILLDATEETEAILDNAYNIKVKDQMITRTKGFETLEFCMPFDDKKTKLIKNERIIEVNDRHYVVKIIDETKAGNNIVIVQCDATWYELADFELLNHISVAKQTARQAINEQLDGTGWKAGTIEITTTHSWTMNEANTRLYNIRYIWKVFGGALYFDTKNKWVHLYESMGERTENIFNYEKNLDSIRRIQDTTELITRVSMVGKDGITIADINNGLNYIENYSWYDSQGMPRKLKCYELKDERFTNLHYMLYYMQQWLNIYSKPVTTYEVSPSALNGDVKLGDYVYIMDKDLGISNWLQIYEREIDILEPYNSKLILEALSKDLSDEFDNMEESGSSESVGNAVSSYMEDMSPFNLLLNSRADDGMAYWSQSGFVIDNTQGVSGNSSFKTVAGSTSEKRITQTIYPSTKDKYTFSAYIQPPDGYEYIEEERIGIEVTLYFDDGTSQTEFISLFGTIDSGDEAEE